MIRKIALLTLALLIAVPSYAITDAVQRDYLPTYAASTSAKISTAAGVGPFFSLCGSATKTVKVWRFGIGGSVATAAVLADVVLRKTSTATSAGTPATLTAVPLDSTFPAATVSFVRFYTALATPGALVGTVGTMVGILPTAVTGVSNNPFVRTFDVGNGGPVVLRGTAQCLEASFGTTTTNSPTLGVDVVWTEE